MTTGRINQVAALRAPGARQGTRHSRSEPELSPGPPLYRRVARRPVDRRSPFGGLLSIEPLLLFLLTRAFHLDGCATEVDRMPPSRRVTRLLAPSSDRPITDPIVPCGSTVPATDSFYLIELLIEYRYKLHRPHALQSKAIARVSDPPIDRILLSELLSNRPGRPSPIPASTCHRRVSPSTHTVLDRPAVRPAIDYACARPPEVDLISAASHLSHAESSNGHLIDRPFPKTLRLCSPL